VPERILAGEVGAFDPLQPDLVVGPRNLPERTLDPVGGGKPFSISHLVETGVELPEATAAMVDGGDDDSGDGPIVLPETWQDVSFSGLAREAAARKLPLPPEVEPSWGDFFPAMTGAIPRVTDEIAARISQRIKTISTPPGPVNVPQGARNVGDLGIAPPFARDERQLSIDIDVLEVDTGALHDEARTDRPSTPAWEEDPIEEVPPGVLEVPPLADPTDGVSALDPHDVPIMEDVPSLASDLPHISEIPHVASQPPIEEDVEIEEDAQGATRRPHSVYGVEAARVLIMRAATGGLLTPREITWLVRCLAGVMLDSLDDARLAAIVSRLGPPEG